MQIFYALLCSLIGWEIVHRKIDFVSIAAASFILYSSNCIIGEVWVPQSGGYAYYAPVNNKTYLLVYTQMLIIYLFLYMKRKGIHFSVRKKRMIAINYRNAKSSIKWKNNDSELYWTAILAISVGSIIYNLVFKINLYTFFSYTAKADILEEVSFLFSLSIWGGVLCFFRYYIAKKNIGIIISSIIIIVSVLLGSRAYIATVLVGILIIESLGWRKKSSIKQDNKKKNKRIIILAIGMLLFLILYKLVYKEIRAGDFYSALNILVDPETWKNVFDIDELRIVFANYNYTIENDIKLPIIDVIARLVSIIPFVNDFIFTENDIRYSTILKNEMHTSYGLGGNFWGESYAMGGVFFVIITTILWMILINRLDKKAKIDRSPFIITIVSYISFYIHRLDWTQVMGCFKIILIFYLIKMMFELLFGKCYLFYMKKEDIKREIDG